MKFNVQSKLLLTRLNAVSKVVSSKNAYAILENFLFELQSDRLVVTGSDMETRLTTNIEVQNVEGSGKFALNVKRTINSLKELPDTGLTFEINDETLAVKVSYVNGYYDAVALNGDEYPEKAATANEVQRCRLLSLCFAFRQKPANESLYLRNKADEQGCVHNVKAGMEHC